MAWLYYVNKHFSLFTFIQLFTTNYNEDNYNVESHETAENKENDGHSNQDLIVNCMKNLKQKANETSSCAQGKGAHQTKNPRNDEILYYKDFPVQRRNARHIAKDGRNAGLLNNNVICYANAIFQIIASCNHLNEFFLNPPRCSGAVLAVCVTSVKPDVTRQLLNPVCTLRSNVPNEKGSLKSS